MGKKPTWPSTLAKVYVRQGSLETSVVTIVMDYDAVGKNTQELDEAERDSEVNDNDPFLWDTQGEEDSKNFQPL